MTHLRVEGRLILERWNPGILVPAGNPVELFGPDRFARLDVPVPVAGPRIKFRLICVKGRFVPKRNNTLSGLSSRRVRRDGGIRSGPALELPRGQLIQRRAAFYSVRGCIHCVTPQKERHEVAQVCGLSQLGLGRPEYELSSVYTL